MELLITLLPSAGTLAGVALALFVIHWLLERRPGAGKGHKFRNQMTMLVLTAVGLLVIIMVAPLGDAKRGQLLSLIGILLSAAIALSSTTILGNGMAGLMLRAVRSFRTGDFVRCGSHFGRVSERGLFHTEIQTEDRDLTTLPNLFLITNPVTTVRSSGTVVSATVSLGYDVPRKTVESLLLEAGEAAGLSDPFIQILELGDFSVSYRIAGLLTEVKHLLTVRSRLRGKVLDVMHGAGVEIVSPSFMNQRVLAEGARFIPEPSADGHEEPETETPEAVVFDKAEEAESLEAQRLAYDRLVEEIAAARKNLDKGGDATTERERADLERLERRRERLEKVIAAREGADES